MADVKNTKTLVVSKPSPPSVLYPKSNPPLPSKKRRRICITQEYVSPMYLDNQKLSYTPWLDHTGASPSDKLIE